MSPATHRLIALGASNLARTALAILDAARAQANGPVDAHFALGRGRSYGTRSRVLGRGLSSILECGLWPALATLPRTETTAIVMDVGNDLLYGVDPPRILSWVEQCLLRLQPHTDRIVVLGLPMESARTIRPFQFEIVRRILVPSCRLDLPGALAGCEALELGLRDLALRHGAAFQTLPGAWYGLDPMHVRRRFWRAAARSWLAVDERHPGPSSPVDGAFAQLRFLLATPDRRTWFGRERRAVQPALRWPCGTTAALW